MDRHKMNAIKLVVRLIVLRMDARGAFVPYSPALLYMLDDTILFAVPALGVIVPPAVIPIRA